MSKRDVREDFLSGVLTFYTVMREIGLDPSALTVMLSEADGRKLEHILTEMESLTISTLHDQRYSKPNEDGTREFLVAGVRFAYRPKLYKMPGGAIL